MAIYYSNLVNSVDRNIPARVQEFRGNLVRSDIEIDATQMSAIGATTATAGDKLVLMPIKWNTTIKNETIILADNCNVTAWKLDLVLLDRKPNGDWTLVGGGTPTAPSLSFGSYTFAAAVNPGAYSFLSGTNYVDTIVRTLSELAKLRGVNIPDDILKSENLYMALNLSTVATLPTSNPKAYTGKAIYQFNTVEATPAALGQKATYKAP